MNSRKRRFRVLFGVVLMAVGLLAVWGSTALAQPLAGCSAGLTNYWKLDEQSGVTFADSLSGVDASCTGGIDCPSFSAGLIGNALTFDGLSDGISVPADDSFNWGNTDSFSIELWVKMYSTNTCSGGQVLAGRRDPSMVIWYVECTDGKAEFYLSDKDSNSASVTGLTSLNDGEWHHLVAVRDAAGGQIHVYVDGALESSASVTYTGGFDSATAGLNIGWLKAFTGQNYYRFKGVIDEVAVYWGALTPAEISQHYHDGVIGLRLGYCGCASPIRIMPLGDSITAGDYGDARDPNTLTGYRKPLDQSLTNGSYYFDFVGGLQYGSLTFPPVWDIDHEGHMGFRANGPNPSFSIAPNVSGYLAANPADVVLLHIGTNDISHDSTTVVDDVATILDNIDAYSQDITVVLARIISRTDGNAAQTSQFNADLAAMAASRIANGDKIIVVDQEVALTYPDDLADTLHPNDVGYGKMAAVWMGALEQFLPVCSQAVPQILSTPIESGTVGKPYTYRVSAVGFPAPTFSLLTKPSGMTINATTGVISYTPSTVGNKTVKVQASNSAGFDNQTFTIQVSETPPCPSGMSHYWKLDEAAAPFADFYGTASAACTTCPTPTTGKVNGARQFTSSSKLNIPDDNTFDWAQNDSFSIELWIRTTSACAKTQVIAGRRDSSMIWYIGCTSGKTEVYVQDKSGLAVEIVGNADINDGQWHHLVAVNDGSNGLLRLFINGVEDADPVSTGYQAGFDSSSALNIGWLSLGAGFHFIGAIDEIALYDAALSATEIRQHFLNAGAAVTYCDSAAPQIVSTAGTSAILGQPYAYDVEAIGSPTPTFDLPTKPSGMTINATTGVISWTPSSGGSYDVTVSATNSAGTNTQSFSINIVASHTVTASAGSGGQISPAGQVVVGHGQTKSFSIAPEAGYAIEAVSGCGGSLNGTTYTTTAITADCTVTATFVAFTSLSVTDPNGGILQSGVSHTIRWNAPPGMKKFKLKYSLDGGATWTLLSKDVTTRDYSWPVPAVPRNLSSCLIGVVGFDAAGVKAGVAVSSPFSIQGVAVTSPSNGAVVKAGDNLTITWSTSPGIDGNVAYAVLKYTKNGGLTWKTIATLPQNAGDSPNPGIYSWTVPAVPTEKSRCMVKVILKDASGIKVGSGISDGFFTIQP